ncbi:MAG: hypothetical protein JJ895_05155 [Balneolaceae bacterium]|nr:hypothetical protein [Balneolaceae bacterium]
MRATVTTILITAGVIFSSCIAAIGPEGPSGRDGRDGEVEINNGTFVIDSNNDFGVVDEYISVASYAWGVLDVSTVDEGLVLAYIQFDGSTAWQSLPLSTPFENDVVVLRYGFDIDNFDLILEGESPDNNQINESIFDGDIIRVIAIPPGQLFKGKNIDYADIEQVKQLYNLDF